MNRNFTIALMCLVLSPAAAHAQTAPDRAGLYVDGAMVADLDPNIYSGSPYSRPAVAVGVGRSLGRLWTMRFEATVPAWHEGAVMDVFGCGCSASTPTITTNGREAHRMVTYGVLFGRNYAPGPSVQVTPVVGVSIGDHADREESTTTVRGIGGVTVQPVKKITHEALFTFVFGADVALQVSKRIAIVPQIRFHGVGAEEWLPILRPGIAMRVKL